MGTLMEKLSAKKWQELWQLADSTLVIFLFFPSMVFYWRGIWDLYGVYIVPYEIPEHQWWIVTGFGACSIVGYFAAPFLSYLLSFTQSKVLRAIAIRVYLFAFAILAMAYWRGVWGVADVYLLELGWSVSVAGLCISHGFLLVLRCSRTTIFPPFIVNLDTRKDVLGVSTCFQTEVNWRDPLSVFRYSLDSMFTQYFILTMTIVSWRCSLALLDIFMYPHDWLLSNLVSTGAGFAATIVIFALETPCSRINAYLQEKGHWLRLIYEDIVYLVVFGAVSLIWRGTWNLNVIFIFTDPKVGGWVNLGIGTFLLMSLQLMSYAGCCGCAFDGRDSNPRDAFYPTKYIRAYIQQRQQITSDVTTRSVSSQEVTSNEVNKEEEISAVSMEMNTDVTNARNANQAFRLDEESAAVITYI